MRKDVDSFKRSLIERACKEENEKGNDSHADKMLESFEYFLNNDIFICFYLSLVKHFEDAFHVKAIIKKIFLN